MARQISTAEERDPEETQVNSGLELLYLRSSGKKPMAFLFVLRSPLGAVFLKVAHDLVVFMLAGI
jgi:hypothetical protein